MSVYEVNKFCHRLTMDPTLRVTARRDLPAALAQFELTTAESRAVSEGDVGYLLTQGVHPVLLVRLCTHGIAGLTEATYSDRIRASGGRHNQHPGPE